MAANILLEDGALLAFLDRSLCRGGTMPHISEDSILTKCTGVLELSAVWERGKKWFGTTAQCTLYKEPVDSLMIANFIYSRFSHSVTTYKSLDFVFLSHSRKLSRHALVFSETLTIVG